MNKEINQRLKWVELYLETQDAGWVTRRCGIARPTLRKGLKRYEQEGLDGLQEQSRRPHNAPNAKVGAQEASWILRLRKHRQLGARRIQNELFREHNGSLALATIHGQKQGQTP